MLLWPLYVHNAFGERANRYVPTRTATAAAALAHTGTGNRGWRRLRLTDGVIITSHHTRVLPEKSWKISGQHCVNGVCVW